MLLPTYLSEEILLHPENREFPDFSVSKLMSTVFEPTQGCKVCILIDFDEPQKWGKDFAFLENEEFSVQRKAYENFYLKFKEGVLDELGMSGGEMFSYYCTNGSNLDLRDEVFDVDGKQLSLDKDIYTNYDIVLCISTWSATAPLTAKCKEYGFRGATMHGMNDVILNSGLAVDYNEFSADAEKVRIAMDKPDSIEIDFALEDGRVLTAWLGLDNQPAQKSHGLCKGMTPDIANLPAGEVYFVPCDARGEFPMKYEDGTLGVLTVRVRT
jgi:aminopeptidase